MVYSTCTLNEEENEKILQYALENFGFKLVDIEIELKEAEQAFFENYDKNIKKSIRVLPSKTTEGFFVAKLKKE